MSCNALTFFWFSAIILIEKVDTRASCSIYYIYRRKFLQGGLIMSKSPYNLIGQRFGRWTVIEAMKNPTGTAAMWLCKCDCGTERGVLGKNLRNGRSTSCGCYKKEIDSQRLTQQNKNAALDLRGHKYGKLTPLEPTDRRLSSSVIWKCLCDCGNITYVSADNLRGQHPVRSCGCLGASIGEYNIQKILEENNIHFLTEYHPSDGFGRYDFAIVENDKIVRFIEFDGKQHYREGNNWGNPFEEVEKRDIIKNQYAFEHQIPLVRIPYWERDTMTLEMLLSDQYLLKEETYESR